MRPGACFFFFSASRRIWDLRRGNDAARRAGHDGTICFLNGRLLSRNGFKPQKLSEPLGVIKTKTLIVLIVSNGFEIVTENTFCTATKGVG